MSAPLNFPSEAQHYVGKTVKVSRHGEAIWLHVKSARPGNTMVAQIDNNPICWPYNLGDAVDISPDEVIGVYAEEEAPPEADATQRKSTSKSG